MTFEFATAGTIVFGDGATERLGSTAAGLGSRPLLVTGASPGRAAPAMAQLEAAGLSWESFAVTGEPTVDTVRHGVEAAREGECDMVVAFGGGSAIDAGKAIAALVTNPGPISRYLEVIGDAQPLTADPLPMVAMPTTAGTGAEVTRNAVMASPEDRVKVSLRHPKMLPAAALVDPVHTHGAPPEVTAATGLDALTQVIEPLVSHRASPLTDGFCREAIPRAAASLARAYRDGSDASARSDMSLVSLLGGLALANAALGAVHGFAGPLGGMHAAPHGAICGRLLPLVVEANVAALRDREPDHPVLARFVEVAQLLTGQPGATVDEGVGWLQGLCDELAVPGLASYGMTRQDVPAAVEAAARSSSMKGNPIVLTDGELTSVLERAL